MFAWSSRNPKLATMVERGWLVESLCTSALCQVKCSINTTKRLLAQSVQRFTGAVIGMFLEGYWR